MDITNETSLTTSSFPDQTVKMSLILQKAAEWGPLIKVSTLLKNFALISSL